jgi:DNA-binding NarL/FixJ family response regulator
VRNGLKELIEKLGPYQIIREFDDGPGFIASLSAKPEPDLVIMDINMPGMNGEAVMQELHARQSQLPLLFLTLNEDENLVIRLFRLGARGYLRKNCSATALKAALAEIFERGYYHNEFLTLSLRSNEGSQKKNEQEVILEQLSGREREFLKLVCHEKEYTYEQIADRMKVQHRTVDGYREAIFSKFGIKSKTGLVLFILRHRLFDLL